jgi:Ca2+/Na+ antiporter
MKVWKLVSGILSCILFVLVAFQSCAAGVANTLEDNGEASGSGGIILACLMLAGGIVSIATKNSEKNGGNIALIVLFGLAALIGFSTAGSYADLNIWAVWCLINAVLAIVAIVKGGKKAEEQTTETE